MNRLSLLLLLALPFAGCDSNEPVVNSCANESREIVMEELVTGTSPARADANDLVRINYVGQLEDGTVFDSATNYTERVSAFVAGFSEGVTGMRIGSKRRLTIPPYLAYSTERRTRTVDGEEVEIIPACSTLIFEVVLLDILT
ncbi:FKBP-type peptidyl-prolyl cis-trans isomerase [Rubricoccus marinus]|nr:FKBP-type peptidyl-prolyl cis-trans isomerase [Rubricoccus marinus]